MQLPNLRRYWDGRKNVKNTIWGDGVFVYELGKFRIYILYLKTWSYTLAECSGGELTIEGMSSDDAQSNCQVYADINDITPVQNATASGLGGSNDCPTGLLNMQQNIR
jgi:hypothetical protein